jgi:hypothetical protein
MGHCEMNWEVAGLTRDEIADRSRVLASDDWSLFPDEQQHAFAFARKLSLTPWQVSASDVDTLQRDFDQISPCSFATNVARYHYMNRI